MFSSLISHSGRPLEFGRNSMFSVVNATFGTGIVSKAAPTSYAVTACLMHFYNDNSSESRWAALDQISLRATQVNTSGTSYHIQFVKRSGDTYASGGTELTPVNMGGVATTAIASQRASLMNVYFGEITADAAVAANDRIIWREQVRDVIFAADDTIHMIFGEGTTGTHGATTSGTCKVVRMPPIWIGPGESLQIHELSPSSSNDALFEVSACWVEGLGAITV